MPTNINEAKAKIGHIMFTNLLISICDFGINPYLCRPNFYSMIAVVKVAGQQYKVEKDQTLYVPHVEGNTGDKIDLEVLLVDGSGNLSVGASISNKVEAEIVGQVKGDTVIAYKQKRRKGFHKKKGHRTAYTKIKVTSIA